MTPNTSQYTKKKMEALIYAEMYTVWGLNPNETEDFENAVTATAVTLLTILKETLEEALPENPYRIPDGSTAKSLEAPAHAFDVAIDQTKANLAKLIGEDNVS